MKTARNIIIVALSLCVASVSAEEKPRIPEWVKSKADFERWMNVRLVKEILESDDLVICEPAPSGNMVVTKVLKGSAKIGQFWNDGIKGNKVLMCETFGDNWTQTTHYDIDEKGNIYKRGLYTQGGRVARVTSLKNLEDLLQKQAEQDVALDS